MTDFPHSFSDPTHDDAQRTLAILREATRNSPYENRLYLVGGLLRDRALGLPPGNDLDLVLEGDAVALAQFFYRRGVAAHYPVEYPRFGTAMIHVADPALPDAPAVAVELVSARAESYHADSRKPDVRPATLRDDVLRRDFTINTLLENLHTGEVIDLTGRAWNDLQAGILRTPLEPRVTFFDDPLRMLRAVRFAARFDFAIEAETWRAACEEAERLRPPQIAHERIREEFVKIARLPGARFRRGMELLRESSLLAQFLPQMLPMIGCGQGSWHRWDVWTHTLAALEHLPDAAPLETRLALLWHDVGKPITRIVTEPLGKDAEKDRVEKDREALAIDETGIRFYGHLAQGAKISREMMNHLKFSNEEIRDVCALVEKHMGLSKYRTDWTDAAVKRLIRDCGPYLDALFTLTRCDMAATDIPAGHARVLEDMRADIDALRARIDALNAFSDVIHLESPLDGNEIMAALQTGPGPHLRTAKEFLLNEVIEGRLGETDREQAREALLGWWRSR